MVLSNSPFTDPAKKNHKGSHCNAQQNRNTLQADYSTGLKWRLCIADFFVDHGLLNVFETVEVFHARAAPTD